MQKCRTRHLFTRLSGSGKSWIAVFDLLGIFNRTTKNMQNYVLYIHTQLNIEYI